MTAISSTTLQLLIITISTAIVYFTAKKWQSVWAIMAGPLLAFVIAWPVGIAIWSVLFPQDSLSEFLPEAMAKSFLMVIAGSAIGIYVVKRHAKSSASAAKKRKWVRLSLEEAHAHHLYGTRGWLIVFAVGLILGLLQTIGSLRMAAHENNTTLDQLLATDHPSIEFAKIAFCVQAFIVILIIALMVTKQRYFRMIATLALLISWPVTVAIGIFYQFQGQGAILFQGFIAWFVSCGVWVTYLQNSERVRVTFEQTILDPQKPNNEVQTISRTHTLDSIQTNFGDLPATVRPTAQPINPVSSCESPSEEFWEKALIEFDGDQRKMGLWAKLFSEANGMSDVAKASYLKQRAAEMHMDAVRDDRVNASLDHFRTQILIAQSYLQKQEAGLADQEMAQAILKSLSAQGCQEADDLLRKM